MFLFIKILVLFVICPEKTKPIFCVFIPKISLSKNPNFNDTYLTRSINYFLRNMKIIVKNLHITLIHKTNDLYNAVFCADIDYIDILTLERALYDRKEVS